MRPKILLIDDDSEVYRVVEKGLNPLAELDFAQDLQTAEKLLRANDYCLVLIDLYISDENGLGFLKRLQWEGQESEVSKFILLTGKGKIEDEIQTHELGIRDYIKKPIEISLFRALMDKHLKQVLETSDHFIARGPFEINLMKQSILLKGQVLELTLKEFKILQLLLLNLGQVFTREQIFEKVWNEESDSLSRTVDMHISSLRKKLGDHAHLLQTKRAFGYSIELSAMN